MGCCADGGTGDRRCLCSSGTQPLLQIVFDQQAYEDDRPAGTATRTRAATTSSNGTNGSSCSMSRNLRLLWRGTSLAGGKAFTRSCGSNVRYQSGQPPRCRYWSRRRDAHAVTPIVLGLVKRRLGTDQQIGDAFAGRKFGDAEARSEAAVRRNARDAKRGEGTARAFSEQPGGDQVGAGQDDGELLAADAPDLHRCRRHLFRNPAKAGITRSPTAWPSESLTALK